MSSSHRSVDVDDRELDAAYGVDELLVCRCPVDVDAEPQAAGRVRAPERLDQFAEQVGGLVDVGDAFRPHTLPSPAEQHVAVHAAAEVALPRATRGDDAPAAD